MSSTSKVVRNLSIVVLFLTAFGQISLIHPTGNGSIGSPANIGQAPNATPLNLNVTLHGRGASFPQPLIANWTTEYHEEFGNTTIVYDSKGSGAGQNALYNKTQDFSASDAPLNPNQRLLAPNVLHIPETIGSVVLAYNLTYGVGNVHIPKGLNMTGDLIAQIFFGGGANSLHYWDDPAIKALNPGFASLLPHQNITTVHRSDSSGTTFVFTSFLSSCAGVHCTAWKQSVGATTFPAQWPGSANGSPYPIYLTGAQNIGVAKVIAENNYTLGYVELNYALLHHLTFAYVQNPAGFFIEPTLQSTSDAVSNSVLNLPQGIQDWSQVSLLNANGATSYPIASFTYLLVYRELNVVPSINVNETAQYNALKNFLHWAVHTGQIFSAGNYYVPLPPAVVAIDDTSINSITYTINSAPGSKSFSLVGNAATGWSGSTPGPTLSVVSGDTVTLQLSASDPATHEFFVDFNNNGVLDNNETSTDSGPFSGATATPFTFTPVIMNKDSFPAAGTYTYRCKFHPNTMFGSFVIVPQQVAAPFRPATDHLLTSNRIPAFDGIRVSIVGSLVIDSRTGLAAGNITEIGVNATLTSIVVLSHNSVLVSNILVGRQFIVNVPLAAPKFDLGPVLTASLTPSYTLTWRQLDFDADGQVNIVELATIGAHFAANVGGAGYLGQADINADGTINIVDLVLIATHFGFTPIYH